jgi:hypothetical protein
MEHHDENKISYHAKLTNGNKVILSLNVSQIRLIRSSEINDQPTTIIECKLTNKIYHVFGAKQEVFNDIMGQTECP